MRWLCIGALLLGANACERTPGPRHAVDLDAFLQARARELVPALGIAAGGGGGGSSDGRYDAQYDRRIETQGPIAAEEHAFVVTKLAEDTQAWLEARGLVIRSRGTSGDDKGSLERFMYRYGGDDVVGWVSVDSVRNEKGGLTLLTTVTEHSE